MTSKANNTPGATLNLAILVVSCDKYVDLWQPFFALFRRFWPDCPYTVYLLSNYRKIDEKGVVSILVGEDYSWSDNLIQALPSIREEYVFMIVDDLFFIDYVQTEHLQRAFAWINRERPDYVRLNPLPKPDKPYNDLVGVVSEGTLYRTATVMSVWKKTVLLDLLKPGENAWQFEIYGTVRSDEYEKFYSTWRALVPFINCVIKGKWRRSVIRRMKSLGVPLDLNKREIMTVPESLSFVVDILRNRGLLCAPAAYQRAMRNVFKRGMSNYS
jgi:hypothetical protein